MMVMVKIVLTSLISLSLQAIPPLLVVPFEKSMSTSSNFILPMVTEDWLIIHSLYNCFVPHYQNYYQEEPRIPKIIHQIWLGGPLPKKCKKLQKSWRIHHPDWHYILWTDADIQKFGLQNSDLYLASHNYGERSDIARYEILYRMGGLYVDTDFECLAPFDILHHCFDFYTGVGYGKEVQVWNGLIGAAPGHPILEDCINKMGKIPAKDCYEIFSTTGPLFYTKCFFEAFIRCSGPIGPLPVTYFYPWPNYAREEKDGKKYIQPESYAIHHWHRSWFK